MMSRRNSLSYSTVTLPTANVVAACQRCIESIHQGREQERIATWGRVIDEANWGRRLLNRLPWVNVPLLGLEDVPKLRLNPLVQDAHRFTYGKQLMTAEKLLAAAQACTTTTMSVGVESFAAIRHHYKRTIHD